MKEMQRWMNESWTWAKCLFQRDETKRKDRIWSYIQDRVEPDWAKIKKAGTRRTRRG